MELQLPEQRGNEREKNPQFCFDQEGGEALISYTWATSSPSSARTPTRMTSGASRGRRSSGGPTGRTSPRGGNNFPKECNNYKSSFAFVDFWPKLKGHQEECPHRMVPSPLPVSGQVESRGATHPYGPAILRKKIIIITCDTTRARKAGEAPAHQTQIPLLIRHKYDQVQLLTGTQTPKATESTTSLATLSFRDGMKPTGGRLEAFVHNYTL